MPDMKISRLGSGDASGGLWHCVMYCMTGCCAILSGSVTGLRHRHGGYWKMRRSSGDGRPQQKVSTGEKRRGRMVAPPFTGRFPHRVSA